MSGPRRHPDTPGIGPNAPRCRNIPRPWRRPRRSASRSRAGPACAGSRPNVNWVYYRPRGRRRLRSTSATAPMRSCSSTDGRTPSRGSEFHNARPLRLASQCVSHSRAISSESPIPNRMVNVSIGVGPPAAGDPGRSRSPRGASTRRSGWTARLRWRLARALARRVGQKQNLLLIPRGLAPRGVPA